MNFFVSLPVYETEQVNAAHSQRTQSPGWPEMRRLDNLLCFRCGPSSFVPTIGKASRMVCGPLASVYPGLCFSAVVPHDEAFDSNGPVASLYNKLRF